MRDRPIPLDSSSAEAETGKHLQGLQECRCSGRLPATLRISDLGCVKQSAYAGASKHKPHGNPKHFKNHTLNWQPETYSANPPLAYNLSSLESEGPTQQ